MSDFIQQYWTGYITLLTLGGILGCLILLYLTGRKRELVNAENTTGHVWDDDLTEANNPLPRWWVGLFVLTIVFGFGYLALYPGLGSFEGTLDWSSTDQYQKEMETSARQIEPIYQAFLGRPVEQVARDPQAMGIGERLFINNCAQCHGSDARGSKGFPNLTDKDWLHGGSPEKIVETITKGRTGIMPPMAAAVGTAEDVRNVANYVLSLSGSQSDEVKAALGRSKFGVCAACHGNTGAGNPLLGAPTLSDKIWLHGYGVNTITAIVNGGLTNVMPAQEGRLSEGQIHVLAAYVWGLSNMPAGSR